nr:MAG TPA: hypothetical protein [Caudoviricetes sp.]
MHGFSPFILTQVNKKIHKQLSRRLKTKKRAVP